MRQYPADVNRQAGFLAHHPRPAYDYHYVSYVHGDLNATNILVDAHHNVWVIDFFHAGPGHVLKDLARFENDLLYLLTPVEDAPSFSRPSPSPAPSGRSPASRPHSPASPAKRDPLVSSDTGGAPGAAPHRRPFVPRGPSPRSSHWAAHTLSLPGASPLQKQSALAAACSLADQITRTAEAESALRVDRVESELIGAGRLGITLCPGRRERGRDLDTDLARLRSGGVTRLLCLLTDSELNWAGVPDLGPRAQAAGLTYRRCPSPTRAHPGWLTPSNSRDGAARRRSEARPWS